MLLIISLDVLYTALLKIATGQLLSAAPEHLEIYFRNIYTFRVVIFPVLR